MNRTPLLDLIWSTGRLSGMVFTSATGERVEVVSPGESSGEEGLWLGAEIVAGGERRRGTVCLGEDVPVSREAVLRVVTEEDMPSVLGPGDRLVLQIHYSPDAAILKRHDDLARGAASQGCAGLIADMPALHRTSLFTELSVERLRRKTERIAGIFDAADGNWNQTFHILLLEAMGGNSNKDAYRKLASRVTSSVLSREKSSVQKLEALLLGGGGFLFSADDTPKDDYTLALEDEFRHLAAKYSITPLKPAEWELSGLRAANHPALRLAEIAALLSKKDFMLDGMLACRNADDVARLFRSEASPYWDTHGRPGFEHGLSPKRLGRGKSDLVGINLVVPLMFIYGKTTGNETLCERALDLLTTIPPEKNSRVEGWYGRGCVARDAFESQALLQLGNEYCARKACAACPVGRREIKKCLR